LEVYSGNNPNPVLTNDDWGTQAGGAAQVTAIQQATTRAAAFTLPNNSLDAVVLATLQPGPYTVQAKGPANNPNATGVVLIEVYDVTGGNAVGPKAANVSTRGNVGTGTNILIAGFVVNGGVTRRMLIRGAGPTLANPRRSRRACRSAAHAYRPGDRQNDRDERQLGLRRGRRRS
jgi:hypothetical protein